MKQCDEIERDWRRGPGQVVFAVFITIILFVHLGLESQVGVCWADKDKGRECQAEEMAHAKAESGLIGSCSRWFRGAGVGLGYTGAPMRLRRSGESGLKGL